MTIEQARKELERPLVFGDSLQIKALGILNANVEVGKVLEPLTPDEILDYLGEDIVKEWLDFQNDLNLGR